MAVGSAVAFGDIWFSGRYIHLYGRLKKTVHLADSLNKTAEKVAGTAHQIEQTEEKVNATLIKYEETVGIQEKTTQELAITVNALTITTGNLSSVGEQIATGAEESLKIATSLQEETRQLKETLLLYERRIEEAAVEIAKLKALNSQFAEENQKLQQLSQDLHKGVDNADHTLTKMNEELHQVEEIEHHIAEDLQSHDKAIHQELDQLAALGKQSQLTTLNLKKQEALLEQLKQEEQTARERLTLLQNTYTEAHQVYTEQMEALLSFKGEVEQKINQQHAIEDKNMTQLLRRVASRLQQQVAKSKKPLVKEETNV